jgi:hypothetical protein
MMDDTGGDAASTLHAGRPWTVSEDFMKGNSQTVPGEGHGWKMCVARFNLSLHDIEWNEMRAGRRIAQDHAQIERAVKAWLEAQMSQAFATTAPAGTVINMGTLTLEAFYVA